jgi:hypothetical protein
MPINNNQKAIDTLIAELEKLKKGESKIFFYILDCKNTPSAEIANIYVTAKLLQDSGYNVALIYQLEDKETYIGVDEFLGPQYHELKHYDIKKDKVAINVSDFVIIPEVFSNVMFQTSKLPCKRIVFSQNFNLISEIMPLGNTWGQYNINDVITTSETQKKLLLDIMPYLNIEVIYPSIAPYFYDSESNLRDLQISIVTKEQQYVNKIAKFFYLKYPYFKFLTFKHLSSLPQSTYAEEVINSAAVVYVDYDTNFGYPILEAIKSKTPVVAIVPHDPPEWMYQDENKEKLIDGVIWVPSLNEIHAPIAALVKAFMSDTVPETLYLEMAKFDDKFTVEQQREKTVKVFENYVTQRVKEIEETIQLFNNDKLEEEKEKGVGTPKDLKKK